MSAAATSSAIRGTLHDVNALRAVDRDAMFSLLDAHFENVDRATFASDLAEKTHVLLLCDAKGPLVGFSTLRHYTTRGLRGEPLNVLCSGDTIVDPSAWHSAALPREWIAAVRRLQAQDSETPWMWLLITSGFRTYRLLSTFWRSFEPSIDAPTRGPLLDHLACERFGDAYDATTGIVRLARPQRLRPHLGGVPDERLADPHVALFLRLNPGHTDGDELATLCALDDANLTPVGRRVTFGPRRTAEAQ